MIKVLVIPDHNYTFHHLGFQKDFIKIFRRKKYFYNFKQVSYESLYYSELLSTDNIAVTFLNNLHPEYRKINIPEYTTNPSAYHSNKHHFITEKELKGSYRQFDVLLLSYNVLKDCSKLWIHNKFQRDNKLIAILDFPEDEFSMREPSNKNIYRGLKPGKDFNLYFKNIIPKGYYEDNLFPIGPTPIRLENFNLKNLNKFSDRTINIYFSGIINKTETFRNRNELIGSLSKIKNSKFNCVDLDFHYKNDLPDNSSYLNNLSNSKISFSPAGRAWTTTRHFISAIYGCAVLLPEPDCELLDYNQIDGENCISYPMIDKLNESQIQKEISKILEKTEYYLNHLDLLEKISINYKNHIIANHQVKHRGEFILKTIEENV